MYLDGGMGGGGWLLTSFFSIIYIHGLVCYKHTIHGLAGKVSNSAKTHTMQNCLDFVDANSQPNGRSCDSLLSSKILNSSNTKIYSAKLRATLYYVTSRRAQSCPEGVG